MKFTQLAAGNYQYRFYSFDYFLESVKRFQIKNIEIWSASSGIYLEDHSFLELQALSGRLINDGFRVCCVTPEQFSYPINIGSGVASERSRSISYLMRAIDAASILGAPNCLIAVGRALYDEDRQECHKRTVDSLQILGDFAARRKVCLVVEPLPRECDIAGTVAACKTLLDDVGNYEAVKIMIDVDIAARMGNTPKDYFQTFGRVNVAHVHLNDGMPGGHMVLGEGIIPIHQCIREIDQFDYDGYMTLEVIGQNYFRQPEISIRKSLEYLGFSV